MIKHCKSCGCPTEERQLLMSSYDYCDCCENENAPECPYGIQHPPVDGSIERDTDDLTIPDWWPTMQQSGAYRGVGLLPDKAAHERFQKYKWQIFNGWQLYQLYYGLVADRAELHFKKVNPTQSVPNPANSKSGGNHGTAQTQQSQSSPFVTLRWKPGAVKLYRLAGSQSHSRDNPDEHTPQEPDEVPPVSSSMPKRLVGYRANYSKIDLEAVLREAVKELCQPRFWVDYHHTSLQPMLTRHDKSNAT